VRKDSKTARGLDTVPRARLECGGGRPGAPETGSMTHSTEALAPARTGLRKLAFDLTHRRRRYRQLAGVVFVVIVTTFGHPVAGLFWGGLVLSCLGMLVRLWASGYVMKNEVLATVGPYSRVRHPLYVGNLLICAGFCAASGLWWSVPLALAMLLYFYPQTIRYEDQKLQRLFPGDWDRWAAETRALLPRLLPYAGGGSEPVPWALSRSLLRNGEPVHIVLLGAGLWILHARLG
jgi:protein-S-isoprenylcysteine O-methyltransferase Ste14